jgi:hypothetical protein
MQVMYSLSRVPGKNVLMFLSMRISRIKTQKLYLGDCVRRIRQIWIPLQMLSFYLNLTCHLHLDFLARFAYFALHQFPEGGNHAIEPLITISRRLALVRPGVFQRMLGVKKGA